jgi:hypothetical protein
MKRHASLLLAGALLLATAALAQKMYVDWDHSITDFSKYRTFAWVKSKRPARNPMTDQLVFAAIETQITGKGLQLVAKDPDLLVTYNTGLGRRRSAAILGSGLWRLGDGMAQIEDTSQDAAALEVDLVDAREKKIIWRGVASNAVADKNAMNAEKMRKAVANFFKKYPPGVKK